MMTQILSVLIKDKLLNIGGIGTLIKKIITRKGVVLYKQCNINLEKFHLRDRPAPSNTRANSRPFLLRFQYNENHNHKPVFTNCSNYAPVIKEEEEPNTEVIQVRAEDRDPPEEGGII